ncbi:hypothetical protein E6Q11_04305 [Candidatus Dojkabacteria bacterium]|uniref:Uncharacterized protein n=1 Tax=Candidatus Dojkabacteria bacterium TaxID=2099670 RepID=A0A5C7J5X5_9BACT|nr:MAG: hypothetical protein E6Q11_04305 [Candidatus Dojkabacteria bacterium]
MKKITIELKQRKYPICPECGQASLAGFIPPKEGMSFTEHGDSAIDWNKAHLYCTNGNTNCSYSTKIKDLTTPLTEPKETENNPHA